jgi:uncharacterized membrane protein
VKLIASRRNPGLWAFCALSAPLVLLAVLLSLWGLSKPSLWLDEAFTWWFTSKPWIGMIQTVRIDGDAPIYYLVLKTFIAFMGSSEFALRLPSALAYIAGVGLAIALGYEIGGPAAGLVAGWFWAFHPIPLWFGREARSYALAASLALLQCLLFLRLRRNPSKGLMLASLLSGALALITHYTFFALSASLVCASAFEMRQSPRFFRSWAVVSTLSLVPLGLWMTWYLTQKEVAMGIGWIEPPTLIDIPLTVWNLLSGYAGAVSWPAIAFGSVASVLAVIGLAADGRRTTLLALLGGVMAALTAVWVISLQRPIYLDRYLFFLIAPFVAIVSAGGSWIWNQAIARLTGNRRALAGAAIAITLACIGILNGARPHWETTFGKDDWRGMASFFRQSSEMERPIGLSEPYLAVPLRYYGVRPADMGLLENPLNCIEPCWWILRQPYTATHALTQAVGSGAGNWHASAPESCAVLQRWDSPTGISAWMVDCGSTTTP